MKNSRDLQEAPNRTSPFWTRSLFIVISLVIALLAGGIVVVRFLGEQKLQQAIERRDIEQKQGELLMERRFDQLQRHDIELFAIPLAWSVRKELMRQNYDQIDDYFNELITRKEFSLIMLVDPSGTILISTDRQQRGSAFSRYFSGMNLQSPATISYRMQDGRSIYLVPIMGLNGKIGTVVFRYDFRIVAYP